jgi:hypothetical protein
MSWKTERAAAIRNQRRMAKAKANPQVCLYPGCDCRLSAYNDDEVCSEHEDEDWPIDDSAPISGSAGSSR